MKRFKRALLALLLLPACYGVSQGLWHTLHPFRRAPEGSYCFFAGIFSYLIFQWAFFRPMRTYVFGHELTHAVAAWMTGGEVKHFHVSKRGGSVTVSKTNFFVALAPYMVPLYSLIAIVLFYAVNFFYPLHAMRMFFLWLLGATVGFHFALTVFALGQGQPDLKPTGRLLSGVIIFLGNAFTIVFLLGIVFPRTVSWHHFVSISGQRTIGAWRQIGRGGYVFYQGTVHELAHRS